MKKLFRNMVAIVAALAIVTSLAACSDNSEETGNNSNAYTITFDYNYEGAPSAYVIEVEGGDVAEAPDDPQRENYSFNGWYTDSACMSAADLEYEVTADTTYYAGWTITSAVITYNLNYEGSESFTQTVSVGGTAQQPTTPTRDGYLFDNWYTDETLTTAFDFSTAITDNMTLYAGWNVDTGDNVTITYYYNYDEAPDNGVVNTVTIETNTKTSSQSVSRDGYYFAGWYTEAECTTEFDFTARVKESYNLYAKWYKINTFEAEYTDLSGVSGMGYSGYANGNNIITKDTYGAGASNGYYLGYLYNKGITITFNIYAEEDVTDAYIVLSLSAEAKDFTISCTDFVVQVNDEYIVYNSISFTNVPGMSSGSLHSFDDYILNNVTLKKGNNVINLIVNNDTKMFDSGTMYATAPLVDCLRIYTNSTVDWAEGYPLTDNLNGR